MISFSLNIPRTVDHCTTLFYLRLSAFRQHTKCMTKARWNISLFEPFSVHESPTFFLIYYTVVISREKGSNGWDKGDFFLLRSLKGTTVQGHCAVFQWRLGFLFFLSDGVKVFPDGDRCVSACTPSALLGLGLTLPSPKRLFFKSFFEDAGPAACCTPSTLPQGLRVYALMQF
ncbi:hypothetical protein M501DRAFT_784176 [Patellaria atrata CBS 101060]|uniref:Uncharacterized protein n=1 Tax=Patellaria atrata CBS 101060 TaxID=1346257 RepID=A0A9P4SBF3_9PEZI|nr:hypothetical protein M501DRAFT_784176 [Patellaria atrata CBS 101060]